MMSERQPSLHVPLVLGQYSLYAELASGGMATVYLARMNAPGGFSRTVAVKRLHRHLARDPEVVSMFVDEAHLATRVTHTNVVPTLDIVASGNELFLVLEYVKGESLARLLQQSHPKPAEVAVAVSVVVDALNGLHAAHEATDERGVPLSIVHRDVSPQNIIVGADGVTRVLDFGIAKAVMRLQTTREGQIKGKLAYMAPEQLTGTATRATDVYAAGVVLWETLASQRLFKAPTEREMYERIAQQEVVPPSRVNPEVPPELDRITLKAVSRTPGVRFASAQEMAVALEAAMRPASMTQTAQWVRSIAGRALDERAEIVAEIERQSGDVSGGSLVRRLVQPMSESSRALPRAHSRAAPNDEALRTETDIGEGGKPGLERRAREDRGRRSRHLALGGGLVVAALGGAWLARSLSAPPPTATPETLPAPARGGSASNEPVSSDPGASDHGTSDPRVGTRPAPANAESESPKVAPSQESPRAPPKGHPSTPSSTLPPKPTAPPTSPEDILRSKTILDQH
jgi:eukaryotic-like serine/threonine-protein kinase